MKYLVLILIMAIVMAGCATMPIEKDPRGLDELIVRDKSGRNVLVIKYAGNNYYRIYDVRGNGTLNLSE